MRPGTCSHTLGHFAARVIMDQPIERLVDEPVIGVSPREHEIGVRRQVEAAGFTIAIGKLGQQFAGVIRIQAVDHARYLTSPSCAGFGAAKQFLQMAASRGLFTERV